MTRVAFAQRYSAAGTILTEPWAPTGAETYYHRRREWFDACRDCHAADLTHRLDTLPREDH